jgi:ArsR family metal-binding transcriptional regulator
MTLLKEQEVTTVVYTSGKLALECFRQLERRNTWMDKLMDDYMEAAAKDNLESLTLTTTTTAAKEKGEWEQLFES